jgi:hypothetical protein
MSSVPPVQLLLPLYPPNSKERIRPSKRALCDLYVTHRLSAESIGAIFGVEKISVLRWMKGYDIARRPLGRGLANRGLPKPTRDQLYSLVHEQHHSYIEIAAMYQVDGSAIRHWLLNYDIPRPTTWETIRKGVVPNLPAMEVLREMYEGGMSCVAIGQEYGIATSAVGNLCHHYGIKMRPGGWRNVAQPRCLDGHVVRSSYEQRVDDWLSTHDVAHEYEPQLPCDRRYRADFHANGWYIEVWGVAGSAIYERRKKHKIALYTSHGLPLVQISHYMFATAAKGRWERRLARCLSAPQIPPPLPQ